MGRNKPQEVNIMDGGIKRKNWIKERTGDGEKEVEIKNKEKRNEMVKLVVNNDKIK